MDSRFVGTRDEYQDVQMDVKRLQIVQHEHSERLRLLEKRQADDAALKSVWSSPFPGVLASSQHPPQPGLRAFTPLPPSDHFPAPPHMSQNEVFSDELDEHSVLGSLQLDTEEEPIRRGAASRANSVRFDESALHGANWSAHGGRNSADFGPVRPGSGMGGHQMERTLSHKSDGRHSSAGHSVHSMQSGMSGRASSLGLDTNFSIGGREDDDSPLDIPEPPPASTTTLDYSLVKELQLVESIERDADGINRITLPVFLAEARVIQSNTRSASPAGQLPSITCTFEVTMGGPDSQEVPSSGKSIRVFIGSHTLRLHSTDLLLSQNLMTLYGNNRDKLSVPFVRPEDDSVFKNLMTVNSAPWRPRLNAAAPEFVSGDKADRTAAPKDEAVQPESKPSSNGSEALVSPKSQPNEADKGPVATSTASESGAENEKRPRVSSAEASNAKENAESPDGNRRETNVAIRTPWRPSGDTSSRDSTPLSGYQPATRVRSMKVLRPTKPGSAKTGAAYEPPTTSRSATDVRRKEGQPLSSSSASSWGNIKRSISTSTAAGGGGGGGGCTGLGDAGPASPATTSHAEAAKQSAVPRSANPLGSATAFAFLKPSGPPKTPTSAAD
ncbi:hypothetical protein B0T18DRAFT_483281 [Schizothecium vesticola]|uniref:Ubiquitin carboxyl-terminal hydrolase 19 n=1 Tax=Schizothecium vesticola TaxID=314040 RepID=A0AA40BQ55_9PEZI|nr:hypothetical protein B0T18DRAFT_483281 [Schizothecium vesticola]